MAEILRIAKRILSKMPARIIIGIVRLLPDFILSSIGPLTVIIEPTTLCNLRCPLCPRNKLTRETGNMHFEDFKKIIDTMPKIPRLVDLYFMGEPLLAPDIFKMIRYARQSGLKVRISSNGTYLKKYTTELLDSGLSELIVAIDGASAETYLKYRVGGNFNDLIDNLTFFMREKKRRNIRQPEVIFQMVVFRHNEHEIDDVVRLAKKIEVDHLVLKKASLVRNDDHAVLEGFYLPLQKKYLRSTYKSKKINHCMWAFNSAVTKDGKITSCCYDWDGVHARGNVFENGFKKTFASKAHTLLRKKIIGRNLDICENCDYNLTATERIF